MVHDCGKNKCTTYIKERMLLDKHRCQNDADRQNQCQETDQLVFAQLFIVEMIKKIVIPVNKNAHNL